MEDELGLEPVANNKNAEQPGVPAVENLNSNDSASAHKQDCKQEGLLAQTQDGSTLEEGSKPGAVNSEPCISPRQQEEAMNKAPATKKPKSGKAKAKAKATANAKAKAKATAKRKAAAKKPAAKAAAGLRKSNASAEEEADAAETNAAANGAKVAAAKPKAKKSPKKRACKNQTAAETPEPAEETASSSADNKGQRKKAKKQPTKSTASEEPEQDEGMEDAGKTKGTAKRKSVEWKARQSRKSCAYVKARRHALEAGLDEKGAAAKGREVFWSNHKRACILLQHLHFSSCLGTRSGPGICID